MKIEAEILICDIIKYSERNNNKQELVVKILEGIIFDSIYSFETNYHERKARLFTIPTGDGMIVVHDIKREEKPSDKTNILLILAREIQKEIYNFNEDKKCNLIAQREYSHYGWTNKEPLFDVRMGLSFGNIIKYSDINRNINLAGVGLNDASRVMDMGDARQILVTKDYYLWIKKKNRKFVNIFRDLKTCEVKWKEINIYQYIPTNCKFIDNKKPRKLWVSTALDEHPDLWINIDHSDSQIKLMGVKNKKELEQLNKFLKKNFILETKSIIKIEKIYRSAGFKTVYRVGLTSQNKILDGKDSWALCLKVGEYKENNEETNEKDLNVTEIEEKEKEKNLFRLLREIEQRKIFKENGIYLIPKIPKGDKFRVKLNNKFYIETYEYLDNCKYFSGTEKELRSFWEKFTSVQEFLYKKYKSGPMPRQTEGYKEDEKKFKLNEYEEYQKKLTKKFNSYSKNGRSLDQFDYIFYSNFSFIKRVLEDFNSLHSKIIEKNKRYLLRDCHPHNALFRNDECLLILDYENVQECHIYEVLSFTLHRFIREYINFHNKKLNNNYWVKIFLDLVEIAYKKDLIFDVQDFLKKFEYYVNKSTFLKLYGTIEKKYKPGRKNKSQHNFLTSELIKFISFFMESNLLTKELLKEFNNNYRQRFISKT